MGRIKGRKLRRRAAAIRREEASLSSPRVIERAFAVTVYGRPSRVVLNSGEHVPVRYAVVEAASLITSHCGARYERDPRFPMEAQPRDYGAEKELQYAVELRARQLDQWQILTDSVLPIDGPPVIRQDGVVLSGNGRTQSMRLAISLGLYEEVRAGIFERAEWFGFAAEAARSLRQPVLVRIMDDTVECPVELARYGLEMNRDPAQGLSGVEQAISSARMMDRYWVGQLATAASTMPEGYSVRDFMRVRARDVRAILMKSGLVDSRKYAEFFDRAGGLTDAAKELVENALAGLTVTDIEVLRNASPSTRDRLARAGVEFLRMRCAGPAWDLARFSNEAVRVLTRAESSAAYLRTMRTRGRGTSSIVERLLHPERFLANQDFGFDEISPEGRHPAVEALARALEIEPREYVSILREYASRCESYPRLFNRVQPSEVFTATIGRYTDLAGRRLWYLPVDEDEWGVI